MPMGVYVYVCVCVYIYSSVYVCTYLFDLTPKGEICVTRIESAPMVSCLLFGRTYKLDLVTHIGTVRTVCE